MGLEAVDNKMAGEYNYYVVCSYALRLKKRGKGQAKTNVKGRSCLLSQAEGSAYGAETGCRWGKWMTRHFRKGFIKEENKNG